MKFCWNIPISFWASFLSHFVSRNFFQGLLKYFLWTSRACLRYLKGLSNLALYVSKKIATARHTNQIICKEKWKKLIFSKNEAQNGVRIFWQIVMFWAETFFSKASRKFFVNFTNMFKVSERSAYSSLNLCVRKKSWPYDVPIKLYVIKSKKSRDFVKWSSKWG